MLRLSSLPPKHSPAAPWNCSFDMEKSTGFILLHISQWDQTRKWEKREHFSFVCLFINEKTPTTTTWGRQPDDRYVKRSWGRHANIWCCRKTEEKYINKKKKKKKIALHFSFCWSISKICLSSCSFEKWAHLDLPLCLLWRTAACFSWKEHN